MQTDGRQQRGDVIRQARKAKDMTQEELAKASGVSVSTVQNIERDAYSKPHPGNVEALCRVLELNYDEVEADEDRINDVRRRMPTEVQRLLDFLGGWLSALPAEQRQAEVTFLTNHIFRDSP